MKADRRIVQFALDMDHLLSLLLVSREDAAEYFANTFVETYSREVNEPQGPLRSFFFIFEDIREFLINSERSRYRGYSVESVVASFREELEAEKAHALRQNREGLPK